MEVWQKNRFDLIVSDYFLEGDKTGADFIRDIRAEGSDVPAVALSIAEQEQSVEAIKNAGFNHYIKKPIDVVEFSSAIDDILS